MSRPTATFVSFRLGGRDGVSVEAAKWAAALRDLGFNVRTVAGEGPVDVRVDGLAIDADDEPDSHALRGALDDADLVIAENICSLPLHLAASRAVTEAIRGRHAVLHHHDLPWQREHLCHLDDFPSDDPNWAHVVTTDLSRGELAEKRRIPATTIRNAFDVDPRPGNRSFARRQLELDDNELVLLQPTRALPRKNVPAGLALAEALGATYWLTGAAEEGYGPELERLLNKARTRTIHGNPGLDSNDVYAAADAVVLPSTWEGFGNPAVESAIHRKPLAIGDYPVAAELRAFGFRWFPVSDPAPLEAWLACPDEALLDANQRVARDHFSLDRLRADLQKLLEARGWLP